MIHYFPTTLLFLAVFETLSTRHREIKFTNLIAQLRKTFSIKKQFIYFTSGVYVGGGDLDSNLN